MTRPITTGMSVSLYHVVGDGSSKLPVHGCLHRSLSGGNPEKPSIHTPRSRQTDATTPNALRTRGFECVSRQADRRADRQTGRQADRQTGRREERDTGRQAGRQTDVTARNGADLFC